ncbi:MAG: hypothetical protein ACP5O8_04025 [Candidatus Aenigmatarchaeota archaeon]
MRIHRYKGKCEFCGKEGEVWRGFKEGKWHWACKDKEIQELQKRLS